MTSHPSPFALCGALIDAAGGALDAAALVAAIEVRRDALATHCLGTGDVLAVTRTDRIGALVDLFAAWECGATVALLDPSLAALELENVLGFLRPSLVADDAGLSTGPDVPRRMDDAAALILFTSGTTGAPKGVVLSRAALEARVAANVEEIGASTLSRCLLTLPLHFGHGLIGGVLTPLAAGGTVVLGALGPAMSVGLGAAVDEHAVTFLTSVPTLWRIALKMSPPPTGGTLHRVHVGSAPLGDDLWQRIAAWAEAPVWNCYGTTETANWIGGARGPAASGHVGRPWGGAYRVRGDDGTLREAGDGEVIVASPSLMSGYLDRPDDTTTVLRDGWYATGDTGTLDESGLTLSGRIKDEINRAGMKVQPADVDLVLEASPMVAEACSFAVPDRVSGETVAAAIVPVGICDTAALGAWCRERMRAHAVPERWFVLDAIPRTERGKVSRAQVATHCLEGQT